MATREPGVRDSGRCGRSASRRPASCGGSSSRGRATGRNRAGGGRRLARPHPVCTGFSCCCSAGFHAVFWSDPDLRPGPFREKDRSCKSSARILRFSGSIAPDVSGDVSCVFRGPARSRSHDAGAAVDAGLNSTVFSSESFPCGACFRTITIRWEISDFG